ncbi:hypothetical protein ACIBUZ_23575 [Micromonospora echinofusca]|uniref:hypothetical protein n=1 Tax=Micromonospora echinofusca TaxID=47858 RepID=UPI0037AC88AC
MFATVPRFVTGSLAGALLAMSGCSSPDGSPTPSPSREIRDFDFANAEWFDTSAAETVTLEHGSAKRSDDASISPMDGGGSWKLLDAPRFADADGDGDEDAAVGLSTSGGQSVNAAWYIWLWRDGSAVQLQKPIVSTTRCDRPIEAVTAVTGGFEVRAFLFHSDKDNCGGGGVVPISYVAGVRDGWPVRIRPTYGPLATCNPQELIVPLRPVGVVQLRVDTDDRAPVVEPAQKYDSLLVSELAVSPYIPEEQKGDWVLARAARGDELVCGYVRMDQIL